MMRTKFLAAMGCLVAAAVLPAADHNLRADIPFSFTTASSDLPAGRYDVTVDVAAHRLQLVDPSGNSHAALFMTTVPPADLRGGSELVFHKYGDSYYLREVRTASATITMPVSPEEKFAKRASTGNRGPKMALVRVAVR